MATATYPPPPPYYRLYKDYLQDPKSAPEPPPPIEGTYICFGGNYTTSDVLPSLEEQGVRQLYSKGPNIDFKKELRSLNGELLLHILELADILIERPSQYARRVEEISTVFKNLHHLLNSLRPHQARATLIHILELQIERSKQAVEDIKSWTAITQLAHHGMLFVPVGYTFGPGMFKMDYIRGGTPYGAGVYAGDGTREPSETELALAVHQGKLMAVVVKRLAQS